jgi:hypothetical protein
MLKISESQSIIVDCIFDLNGRDATVDQTLKSVGFPDKDAVSPLCDRITTSTKSGVKAYDHVIDRAVLGPVGPNSTVRTVAKRVRDNATPKASK